MTGCCYVTQDRTLRYGEYISTVDSLKKGVRDQVIKRGELRFRTRINSTAFMCLSGFPK